MRISRVVRLQGALFLSMLFLQGTIVPLGACQVEHDVDHEDHSVVEAMQHDGGERESSHHESAPTDCLAISGCGVPAFASDHQAQPCEYDLHEPRSRDVLDGLPPLVDLGITTPPPKIRG